MSSIRKADYAILIISDSYLKSLNCMREIMHLDKEENMWDKVLPIFTKDVKLYSPLERIKYISYWEQQTNGLETLLKSVDSVNAQPIYAELKEYKLINLNLGSFLSNLTDRLVINQEALFEETYRSLFQKMQITPDFTHWASLAGISFIKDHTICLNSVQAYLLEHNLEHSMGYGIIGSCYRKLKMPNEAIAFYKKSIEIDAFNELSWNNLGQVYELLTSNYDQAKLCYEKAIDINPKLDIPRLNLGCLLMQHFKDNLTARHHYEEILKFEENNLKAHNNLAMTYNRSPNELDIVEKHLKIAASQNYIDAMINYGSFLIVDRKLKNKGLEIYRSARNLNVNEHYNSILDSLIEFENSR